jgi:hypothetical protein
MCAAVSDMRGHDYGKLAAPQLRHSRPRSRAVIGPSRAVDPEPGTRPDLQADQAKLDRQRLALNPGSGTSFVPANMHIPSGENEQWGRSWGHVARKAPNGVRPTTPATGIEAEDKCRDASGTSAGGQPCVYRLSGAGDKIKEWAAPAVGEPGLMRPPLKQLHRCASGDGGSSSREPLGAVDGQHPERARRGDPPAVALAVSRPTISSSCTTTGSPTPPDTESARRRFGSAEPPPARIVALSAFSDGLET